MAKKEFWGEMTEKYDEKQVLFIGGEWLPCYFAYKKDPAKLQASMMQVMDMVKHRHSKYVIDKLYATKKALDGRYIGYCSQWMDKAFCLEFEPEGIEDEKVREFVKENIGWFRNLVVVEEGFDKGMNKLMRVKVEMKGKKFIFDEKMVNEFKGKERDCWDD